MRRSGAICSSFQRPRSCADMRPSGNTAVASAITSPAPPTALLPRCTRCQSLARPCCAEYWHIGDTAMRFLKTIFLICNGANSNDIAANKQNDENVKLRNDAVTELLIYDRYNGIFTSIKAPRQHSESATTWYQTLLKAKTALMNG